MSTSMKGLVIKEQTIGESDRLVTLLTADNGLVRAFARGAKQVRNRMSSSTSLFAYSTFSLYRGRDAYVIENASPIEVFFDLRKDIKKLALAQYFTQLAYELGEEEQPGEELLSLILNALHLLCNTDKDLRLVKTAVELRALTLGGYMPDVLYCQTCGEYESELMYFDIAQGCIYCDKHGRAGSVPCPKNVITAIRFICLTEPKKVFSFSLSDENFDLLSDISEKYLISRIQRNLPTLSFYKGL